MSKVYLGSGPESSIEVLHDLTRANEVLRVEENVMESKEQGKMMANFVRKPR